MLVLTIGRLSCHLIRLSTKPGGWWLLLGVAVAQGLASAERSVITILSHNQSMQLTILQLVETGEPATLYKRLFRNLPLKRKNNAILEPSSKTGL